MADQSNITPYQMLILPANSLPVNLTGSVAPAQATTVTSYGASVIAASNAGALATLLGLGSAAFTLSTAYDAAGAAAAAQATAISTAEAASCQRANNLSDLGSVTTAVSNLGLSNATLQGNTFNAANDLVQLNGSGQLPALDGSLLTGSPIFSKVGIGISPTYPLDLSYGSGTVLGRLVNTQTGYGAVYLTAYANHGAGVFSEGSGLNGFIAYSSASTTPNTTMFYSAGSEVIRFNSTGPVVAVHGSSIGYVAGSGGSVVQATNKSAGVTLARSSGLITTANSSLNAGAIVSFVLTNTQVAATDVLVINHASGGTPGAYVFNSQCAAGSATIFITNVSAGSLSESLGLQFVLIKGATS